jgi:tetratricopeptide (TPR) repeat protein
LAAATVLAGARSIAAPAEWAADAPPPVRAALGARRDAPEHFAVPAEATIRRTLSRLDADALAAAVGAWLADRERERGRPRPAASRWRAVATDGKTLRGARGAGADGRPAHHSRLPEVAPAAAYNLGQLLAEQGDVAGARTAYQQAIDSGHPDWAPEAAYNLGLMLRRQGDVTGARTAYQQAIDSGHREAAPTAGVGLGLFLAEQGDVAGARTAYQQAIDSGHPRLRRSHNKPSATLSSVVGKRKQVRVINGRPVRVER